MDFYSIELYILITRMLTMFERLKKAIIASELKEPVAEKWVGDAPTDEKRLAKKFADAERQVAKKLLKPVSTRFSLN
jgi:hypothetical protein